MNATYMMVSQGGMALAGIVWGSLATALSLEWALFSASALGIVSALTAKQWSIDFSTETNLEGADCQLYAYEILRHFGLQIPDFRSINLWEDTQYTDIVSDLGPLDIVLFNRTKRAGARTSVYASVQTK